jgi:ADP-ribosylglycohydrolase
MLVAAMLAWAWVTSDVEEIIRVGLSEIPRSCRLAEAVRAALDLHAQGGDWEAAYEHLLLSYGSYAPLHVINNTVWTVLALLYGGGDFDRTLGMAVACGLDTASNAATVGSVMGLLHSSARIPAPWVAPLEDTLYTAVAQFPTAHISDLARRTAVLAEHTLSD